MAKVSQVAVAYSFVTIASQRVASSVTRELARADIERRTWAKDTLRKAEAKLCQINEGSRIAEDFFVAKLDIDLVVGTAFETKAPIRA